MWSSYTFMLCCSHFIFFSGVISSFWQTSSAHVVNQQMYLHMLVLKWGVWGNVILKKTSLKSISTSSFLYSVSKIEMKTSCCRSTSNCEHESLNSDMFPCLCSALYIQVSLGFKWPKNWTQLWSRWVMESEQRWNSPEVCFLSLTTCSHLSTSTQWPATWTTVITWGRSYVSLPFSRCVQTFVLRQPAAGRLQSPALNNCINTLSLSMTSW